MKTRKIIAGAVVATALAGGTAGAIAASSDPQQVEQEVLADAADQLGVSAGELRSALAAAEDAQLDEAVKAGRLTQEQADEIREHRDREGTVLGIGPGGPGAHDGPHGFPGPGGPMMDDVATALGISEQRLFDQLRDGKSIKQIAEANGKSLDEVKTAVEAAVTKRLDADVQAGRITDAQRDELLDHLGEHIDHLGEEPSFEAGERGFHGRMGPPPVMP
jgi:hypothetical protein